MFHDSNRLVQDQLSADEKLLWTGRPPQGVMLQSGDLFAIPFSILWAGFAFFWETSVIASHAPFFFCLWGIPFVLIGLYITVGRFFFDARNRARTVYAVTDERVLIISGKEGSGVLSLDLRTLSNVSLQRATTGVGTITFGPEHPVYSRAGAGMRGWPGTPLAPKFERIPDAKSVYDLIREAQKAAR